MHVFKPTHDVSTDDMPDPGPVCLSLQDVLWKPAKLLNVLENRIVRNYGAGRRADAKNSLGHAEFSESADWTMTQVQPNMAKTQTFSYKEDVEYFFL